MGIRQRYHSKPHIYYIPFFMLIQNLEGSSYEIQPKKLLLKNCINVTRRAPCLVAFPSTSQRLLLGCRAVTVPTNVASHLLIAIAIAIAIAIIILNEELILYVLVPEN